MTLRQLRYFEAVVQCGSISRAARVLFVAQPSVSVALRELEEELGFPLLERGSFGARPTEKGERLLACIEEIFSALERIEALGEKEEPLEGSFEVGVDSRFSTRVASDAMLALSQEHPGLDIQMKTIYNCPEMFQRISSGELLGGVLLVESFREAVLCARARQMKLQMEQLLTDELIFIVRPEHPLADRGEVPLAELLKYPYASMMNSAEFLQSDRCQFFQIHGYRQRTVFLNNTAEIERFVLFAESNPVTMLSSRYLAMRQGDGIERFRVLKAADVPLSCSLYWIWRRAANPGAGAAFHAALVKVANTLPDDASAF